MKVRSLPFEYRTTKVSGIQMNPVFRCPVFRWLLYFCYFIGNHISNHRYLIEVDCYSRRFKYAKLKVPSFAKKERIDAPSF